MRPLIGIPPRLDEGGRRKPRRDHHYLDATYARAVECSGGIVVLLPLQEHAADLVERIDGLLLPGGGDFAPDRAYPRDVAFDPVAPRQLAFDTTVLREALERGRPILGICYGMQLLALEHGGTLVYDLASDAPGAGPHQLADPDGRHDLRLEPGTRLAEALGERPGPVNSRHHQAVDRAGDGLRVCARACDGVVEAIERGSGPFCVGVQWHPERMEGPHHDRLFAAFVAACRDRRTG